MDALNNQQQQVDKPEFEFKVRGYDRAQVDSYIASMRWEISELRDDLTRAKAELTRVQGQLTAQPAVEPAADPADEPTMHEQLSGRMAQIWELAQKEAEQTRTLAEAQIAEARASAFQQIEQMEREARAKADGKLAEAWAEADQALSSARSEAASVTGSAKEQAERTVASARMTADQLVREAQQRADAIDDEAATRLDEVAGRHSRAVRDLTAVYESLGTLMDAGALTPIHTDLISGMPARHRRNTARRAQLTAPEPRDGDHERNQHVLVEPGGHLVEQVVP